MFLVENHDNMHVFATNTPIICIIIEGGILDCKHNFKTF